MTSTQRWSADHPCPICGGHQDLPRHTETRCHGFLSSDGGFAYCSRCLIPGRPESSGCSAHWLEGPCECGRNHQDHAAPIVHPRAPERTAARANRPLETTSTATGSHSFDSAYDCLRASAQYQGGTLSNVWIYYDRDPFWECHPTAAVGRIDFPDGKKAYRPAHRAQDGHWAIGDPPGLWPLYNLADLKDAQQIIVVEGEKCADLLGTLGFVAVTSAHGAGAAAKTDWSPLAGRTVILIPDHDTPGQKYALEVGSRLRNLGCTVWFCDLPNLQEGEDVEQWLDRLPAGSTKEQKAAALTDLLAKIHTAQLADEDKEPQTEQGNATMLVTWHGDNFRHVKTWGKPIAWDDKRWVLDHNQGYVYRYAQDTIARRTLVPKFRKSSESNHGYNNMISIASRHEKIMMHHDELDQNIWLLNCVNGTVNLQNGELREHRRSDYLTQLCPTPFDPDADCPLWKGALELIFGGDQELIDYLQRLFGYSLTGSTEEQIFPIFYGSGENGKSTLLNTFLRILGPDYSMKAPRDFFMDHSHSQDHPTVLADLFRKRLVIAAETAQGQKINEPLVKEATGGDPIRARRMREDFWEFLPTHKVYESTNHKPRIEGGDHAIWRRLMLIPCIIRIPAEKKDPRFPEKLASELPGILNWSVTGCLNWLDRGGLEPPAAVTSFTAEYRYEEDLIGQFLSEECVTDLPATKESPLKVPATVLYKRYCDWCEARGEHAFTQREFGKRMSEREFYRYRANGVMYSGVGLRADQANEPTRKDWE